MISRLTTYQILKNTLSFRLLRQYSVKLKTMEGQKTLKELGYAFNADGQLRKIGPDDQITDEPFQFNISDKHQECQSHYEKLGDAVTNYIFHLLEAQEGLIRLPVPVGSTSQNGTFIFASKDYDQKDKLMLLIHGSGAVRAGQWARSLIINNNVDMGSQIPYIRKAVDRDFGIIVLNANDNSRADGMKIVNSSTPEEHCCYVWDTYIAKAKASTISIVAHSYGGMVTVMLSEKMKKDFERRVKVIALTDSVHGFSNHKISKHLIMVSKNWVSSTSPLDTPMKTSDSDITRVSAGDPQHEKTSHSCIDSVFNFIDEKIKS